jgi:hypothetical protein
VFKSGKRWAKPSQAMAQRLKVSAFFVMVTGEIDACQVSPAAAPRRCAAPSSLRASRLSAAI